MKSVSIADLRDQVLVFLLEWHFAERAKGRDFYFLIERPDTFFFAVKDRIALPFWQHKSCKDGTYNLGIVIKTDCSVYLDAKRQNKNQEG